MHSDTISGGAQSPQAESSAHSVPAVRYVYDARSGSPIPVALADKRAARAREFNTPLQRRRRERTRTGAAEAAKADMTDVRAVLGNLDMGGCYLSRAEMQAEACALRLWLVEDGPRQRQHRARAKRLLTARIALLNWRRETWSDPEPAEFAPRLAVALGEPVSRQLARDTLYSLLRLESEGGPWQAASS